MRLKEIIEKVIDPIVLYKPNLDVAFKGNIHDVPGYYLDFIVHTIFTSSDHSGHLAITLS